MPAEDHVGLTGPPFQMEIERGRIMDFARASYAPVAEFIDDPHPVIPAPFLVTAQYTWGYSLERPRGTVLDQIDHDLTVPLHATESYEFFGEPPRAGDVLACSTGLESVRRKTGSRGGELTFLTMLTQYRSDNGGLVAEQRAVTVTTENDPDDSEWSPDVPDYEPAYDDIEPGDPFGTIERVAVSDLAAGDSPGRFDLGPLLIGDIIRFQGVGGETNPLHADIALAQASGYPTVFGLGMHQASVLAGYAANWIDPRCVRSFSARFNDVFWPGERLTYSGSVAAIRSGEADLSLQCTRPDGSAIVDVRMTVQEDGT